MLIAFIVFEVFDIWMVYHVYVGQETEKCQLISVGVLISKLRSDFELFDIWKVINIDLNGNGTSEKLRYIRVFDIQ